MFFRIRHELTYTYDRPVFLEPHTLRLTPRQDVTQRLLRHRVVVEEPADGTAAVLEPGGGDAMVLWFTGRRATLRLAVAMEVETLRTNPFDWILTSAADHRLPFTYGPAEAAALAPFLTPEAHPQVARWAAELAGRVERDTLAFLMGLAEEIHHGFHHVGRPEGEALPPESTLAERSGACRDTALLYLAACRSQGLAARFVSGYSMHHPPEVSEQELHAWAEVYLPGGGWRGYDPSLGLAVADGHVALAAAADPRLAAPLSGSFRGTGASSSMAYAVQLRAAEHLQDLGAEG